MSSTTAVFNSLMLYIIRKSTKSLLGRVAIARMTENNAWGFLEDAFSRPIHAYVKLKNSNHLSIHDIKRSLQNMPYIFYPFYKNV